MHKFWLGKSRQSNVELICLEAQVQYSMNASTDPESESFVYLFKIVVKGYQKQPLISLYWALQMLQCPSVFLSFLPLVSLLELLILMRCNVRLGKRWK